MADADSDQPDAVARQPRTSSSIEPAYGGQDAATVTDPLRLSSPYLDTLQEVPARGHRGHGHGVDTEHDRQRGDGVSANRHQIGGPARQCPARPASARHQSPGGEVLDQARRWCCGSVRAAGSGPLATWAP